MESPIGDTPVGPHNPFVKPRSGIIDTSFGSNSLPDAPAVASSHQSPVLNSPSPAAMSRGPPPAYMRSQVKSESLSKWNVTYSGDTCVREFFSRIEEEGIARCVSPSYVVLRFHEVLGGSALKYFRAIRHPQLSYADLKAAFFRTFDVPDYEFKIERQLRGATQLENQSVVEFVIQLRDLNAKLRNPINETDLLTIAKYGLHPRYRPCLATNIIKDMDALLEVSRNFETFQQQTLPSISVAPIITEVPPLCLKCNSPGHDYRGCPNVTGLVCFKCKLEGNVTRNCPRCHPAKLQKN